MRAAAFSSFRKLYRLIDHSSSATTGTAAAAADSEEETEDAVGGELFANGLPAGNYTLTVGYGTFYFFHLQCPVYDTVLSICHKPVFFKQNPRTLVS